MQHEDIDGNKISPAEKGFAPRFCHARFIAAIATICFCLSSGIAAAQNCGIPALTALAVNPCSLPPPTSPPGSYFQQYLQNWWGGQFLPHLNEMTMQLYSYRIWETLELGQLMDAQNINHAARIEQEQRVTAQQGVLPNEQVCVAGSSTEATAKSGITAAALTDGFKKDLLRRAHNSVEQSLLGSFLPAGITPGSDLKNRWNQFCTEFYDPNSNNGQGPCNGASAGPVMDDDISVENFLFRDTIDMNNPHMYRAAQAFLINIIQPIIHESPSPAILSTPQGQEYALRLQHLEAIRNVSADVVGSIISRRAPLPQTDTNLAAQIVGIRKEAGIPACPPSPQAAVGACYMTTPSYNEMMLALSKERFFDPSYFTSMESNDGAIQQEQAAIDGYTTVQLQDIYKLQEQINALLAARASLKLSTDEVSSQTSSAPN